MFTCCSLFQAYDAYFQATGPSGGSDWFVAVQGRTPVSLANTGSGVGIAGLRRTDAFLIAFSIADAAQPAATAACPAWPGQISLSVPIGTEETILVRNGQSGGSVGSGSPLGYENPLLQTAPTCRGDRNVCEAGYADMEGSPAMVEGYIAFGKKIIFRWIRTAPAQGGAAPSVTANLTLWQMAGGGGGLRLTVRRGRSAFAPGLTSASDSADVMGVPGDSGARAATMTVKLAGPAAGSEAALWMWVECLYPLLPRIPFRLVVNAGPIGPCALTVFPAPTAGSLASSAASKAALGTGDQIAGLIGPVPSGWQLVVQAQAAVDAAAGVCRFGSGSPGTHLACSYTQPPVWTGLDSASSSTGNDGCGGCLTLQGWQLAGLSAQAAVASPMAVVLRSVGEVLYPVRGPDSKQIICEMRFIPGQSDVWQLGRVFSSQLLARLSSICLSCDNLHLCVYGKWTFKILLLEI